MFWVSCGGKARESRKTAQKSQLCFARAKRLAERSLKQATAVEPVVIVEQSGDALTTSEDRLGVAHFGRTKLVEAEIRRQMRLLVSRKERLPAYDLR